MARKQTFTYDFPRPLVSVDIVIATRERTPHVLLIRRKKPPYAGSWAIPGGFIEMDETLEESARRELKEETGLEVGPLRRIDVYGDPGRDPRGRTLSVAHLGFVDRKKVTPRAADDAADAAWFPLNDLPELAFDHAAILADARRLIRAIRR